MNTAWQTNASLVHREPKPIGSSKAHAVLRTHNRKRDDHPHARLIVAAGASHLQDKKDRLNDNRKQWRCKAPGHLFPSANLARVFRAKCLQEIKNAGLLVSTPHPTKWVIGSETVGSGKKALVDLGRYFYRRVLPEK